MPAGSIQQQQQRSVLYSCRVHSSSVSTGQPPSWTLPLYATTGLSGWAQFTGLELWTTLPCTALQVRRCSGPGGDPLHPPRRRHRPGRVLRGPLLPGAPLSHLLPVVLICGINYNSPWNVTGRERKWRRGHVDRGGPVLALVLPPRPGGGLHLLHWYSTAAALSVL